MDIVETLKCGAEEYGVVLDDEKTEKFMLYMKLIKEWNEKINLTAIVDDDGIVKKHFLDSLSLISTGLIGEKMSLIDVGTGAGFPGIPLKIVFPDMKVTLLDSLQKRVNFLNEVINELGLKKIEAVHERCEEAGHKNKYREKYDIATARAVAAMPVLCEYCIPFVKPHGHFIAMKGPSAYDEVNTAKNAIGTLGGKLEGIKEIKIMDEDLSHNVIIVDKIKNTDKRFPRKAGKVEKNPIL